MAYADFNCLSPPEDAEEKQDDDVMLSDILPTGYHATELAGVMPGETVAMSGAGSGRADGRLSVLIKGASEVFVVDGHDDRLRLAEELGAIAIDRRTCDPVEEIPNRTNGLGTDRGCERVGYQCCDRHFKEANSVTMNSLVAASRATGGFGVIGVFVPEDPHAKDPLAKEGKMAFDFGAFWFKDQQIRTGQANVKHYNRRLMNLIHVGKAAPSKIISHRLKLDEAPDAYKHLDARDKGWTKVVLKPAA